MAKTPTVGPYGATCKRSDGTPCRGRPLTGSTVCWRHMPDPKARANAIARREFFRATSVNPVDWAEGMQRLTDQALHRAELLAELLDKGLPDDPNDAPEMVKLVVGTAWGESGPTGEYVKALVQLEGQERDRAMRYLEACVRANLETRLVQLDEQRQALLVAVAVRAFGDLLPPEQLHARISRAAAEIEGTVT